MENQDPSSETLLARYVAGDKEAMGLIFDRHDPPLRGFLCNLLRSRKKTDDMAQETWLNVMTSAHTFRGESKFGTWLLTIARRVVAHELEASKRRPRTREAEKDEDPSAELEAHADPGAAVPEEAGNRELSELAKEAIAQLDLKVREAFLLRVTHGHSYREIAEITGSPLTTVQARVRAAARFLRDTVPGADPGV